ncbi:hypothetical protein M9H77_17096 [Catharanthus roseus]|uniref:Uncharacterized protein n=1 Tax=Catharanthus roseus TaxID=4058 RepID=A0ACC0B3N0_CATRO|nr:hypothetical protein M9H77_17096 [Catharanthus roseus]
MLERSNKGIPLPWADSSVNYFVKEGRLNKEFRPVLKEYHFATKNGYQKCGWGCSASSSMVAILICRNKFVLHGICTVVMLVYHAFYSASMQLTTDIGSSTINKSLEVDKAKTKKPCNFFPPFIKASVVSVTGRRI